MVHGSWFMVHGSWFVVRGSWFMVHGRRLGVAVAKTFEELVIWQKARGLVGEIFDLCEQPPLRENWPVRNQLVSASLSIMNNIAEGFERGGNRELIFFLKQSKGSAGEVRSMLYVLLDRKWISGDRFGELRRQTLDIGAGIHGLIRHLQGSDYDGINRRKNEVRDSRALTEWPMDEWVLPDLPDHAFVDAPPPDNRNLEP
jgi:four helix bundle protein